MTQFVSEEEEPMLDRNVHIFDQTEELKAVLSYKIKNCGKTLQVIELNSGLSMPTLRKIANGKIVPKLSTIVKLSHGIGISLERLLYE